MVRSMKHLRKNIIAAFILGVGLFINMSGDFVKAAGTPEISIYVYTKGHIMMAHGTVKNNTSVKRYVSNELESYSRDTNAFLARDTCGVVCGPNVQCSTELDFSEFNYYKCTGILYKSSATQSGVAYYNTDTRWKE